MHSASIFFFFNDKYVSFNCMDLYATGDGALAFGVLFGVRVTLAFYGCLIIISEWYIW